MCRRTTWIAPLLLALAACGASPPEDEQASDEALLDAAQAPLDRAGEVQQTLDDRAARMAEDAAAAMEGRDPDAAKRDGKEGRDEQP
jgi:hypothetical protein